MGITAIAARVRGDRTVELVNLLQEEALKLSEQLAAAGPAPS